MNNFGNSFLGFCVGVALLVLLFTEEPSIFDALRQIVLKYAGLL